MSIKATFFNIGVRFIQLLSSTFGKRNKNLILANLANVIQPGVIDTDFQKKIGRANLADRAKSIPLKRAGTPSDVARLCLFLASEAGDYITGQVYGVTGGD